MRMHMSEELTRCTECRRTDFVNTDEELMTGDFAKVKVTGAAEYDLIGELI